MRFLHLTSISLYTKPMLPMHFRCTSDTPPSFTLPKKKDFLKSWSSSHLGCNSLVHSDFKVWRTFWVRHKFVTLRHIFHNITLCGDKSINGCKTTNLGILLLPAWRSVTKVWRTLNVRHTIKCLIVSRIDAFCDEVPQNWKKFFYSSCLFVIPSL